nr:MAG TPA: hypothetical protein [Caudoviricetes sp.]
MTVGIRNLRLQKFGHCDHSFPPQINGIPIIGNIFPFVNRSMHLARNCLFTTDEENQSA